MRDLIIIFVIIALVFGGGWLIENYLEGSEKALIERLDVFHDQIKANDMTHIDSVHELDEFWTEAKIKWHILANHQEIDEIEAELKRFIEAYELGEATDALLSIGEMKFRINDMHKGEKLELVNIL